jgi:hypothetical protein
VSQHDGWKNRRGSIDDDIVRHRDRQR